MALKSHPFIPIPGALNLRTISSPSLLPNLVLRSGCLSHLSPATLAPLKETYNITTIFDLRSAKEREKSPSPEVPGVETVWIPNTLDVDARFLGAGGEVVEGQKTIQSAASSRVNPSDFVANGGKDGYLKMYGEVLHTHKDAYKAVFEELRDGQGGVLFHCTGSLAVQFSTLMSPSFANYHLQDSWITNKSFNGTAGKDRTGILAALILALTGALREAIAEDYALTRIGVEPFRMHLMGALLKQMGKSPTDDVLEEPGMEVLCGAQGSSVLWMLDWMDETWTLEVGDVPLSSYPGVEGYLMKVLGFNKVDIGTIRTKLAS